MKFKKLKLTKREEKTINNLKDDKSQEGWF